ncbi:MAG: lysylphosphatidylglycerol synthase transmembrane domain-containing protein [Vicinamibacterales bacterium]|jgi:hypothetical protein|nr:hypothetical protein [Acidobacteriota bacterium]MDP6373935.1 lysylphosphatidylglycerol synthase transmembrane domain-containing protein [Vicinamibacterales bacterium]MDP6610527.1 lysylphosphatidylglycerol synthase transmembrane domain-containing protein [Vicinamibacterales bacterium]|tara:strand:+ start:1936 stop:2997 length:1062 start_codon:yes stop_codon:yes gene_type:complete
MSRHLRTIAIVGLTGGLLAFFLRAVDPAVVWREMRGGDPAWLGLALASTAFLHVLRAWRWQVLLLPLGLARFTNALRTTIIGFGLSALLPARPGEVVRPYLLARREGFSKTATFTTIVVERLFDLVSVLLLFAVSSTFFDPGLTQAGEGILTAVTVGAAVSGVGALLAIGLAFAIAGRPVVLIRLMGPLTRVLPSRVADFAGGLVEKVAAGFSVVRQPGALIAALGLSLAHWLVLALGVWSAALAYGLRVPFSGSFLLLVLLTVGVAVPSPGAVGGFHAALQLGLTEFFAAPPDRAAAAAIVLHAISYGPVALVCLALLASEGITVGALRRAASEEETAAPMPARGRGEESAS